MSLIFFFAISLVYIYIFVEINLLKREKWNITLITVIRLNCIDILFDSLCSREFSPPS